VPKARHYMKVIARKHRLPVNPESFPNRRRRFLALPKVIFSAQADGPPGQARDSTRSSNGQDPVLVIGAPAGKLRASAAPTG
jgi:hypothetical protein